MHSIVITGGARGIGLAATRQCVAAGYQVVVLDLDQSALALLRDEGDPRIIPRELDISDRAQVQATLQWLQSENLQLRGLVMSAALHGSCPVTHLTDDTIDRIMDVNLVAHIKFVRDMLPLLDDGARIVGLSSVSAEIGIPMQSLYSASKAALELFYESLGGELIPRGIACSVVRPGNVNTGFNETGNEYEPSGDHFIDETYRTLLTKIDSRNGMSPENVADAVLRALQSKNPRPCYIVGANAIKAHWAKRLLGQRLALRLMRMAMGLPGASKE